MNFSLFCWVKPYLSSYFIHKDIQLPLIFMSFLLVSLEYKSGGLKQSKAHWSECSVKIRTPLSYHDFFGGRECGTEDWVYWGGRTVPSLSSLSGVTRLLKYFRGGLNLKNSAKIQKHVSFCITLNRHPVQLRDMWEQTTSRIDWSLIHGKTCCSLLAFWCSIFFPYSLLYIISSMFLLLIYLFPLLPTFFLEGLMKEAW